MLEVTADMRDEFYEKNGYMGCDDVVEAWHKREIEKNSEPEIMNCMECDKEVVGESLCDECQIKHRDNYPELMKKAYESDPNTWVVYAEDLHPNNWIKQTFDADAKYNQKLILKEHEEIWDAVIANPDVEVTFIGLHGRESCVDFFNNYNHNDATYQLAKPQCDSKELKQICDNPDVNALQINSIEDLNDLPHVAKCDVEKNRDKKCSICKETKPLTDFYKEPRFKDGVRKECKACKNKMMKDVARTKKGLIARIYANQKRNSKKRGHSLPTYTKQDLREWLMSQPKFHVLYDNWKRLDFHINYVPSVDRKNNNIGYTMANIQLMTWKENKAKGHRDIRSGILTHGVKPQKAVIQLKKDGEFVAKYVSLHEADRQTDINFKNISLCCKGKRKTAGGFIWEFYQDKE